MSWKKILIIVVVLAVAAVYILLTFSYSSGYRTGRLVKLSRKGFVIKTYEGTLDLGSGDKLTWDFSIHDDDLGDNLVKHTGMIVRLEYKEHLYKLFYQSKYNVTNWYLVTNEHQKSSLFCRMVNILRSNTKVVDLIRPMVVSNDPSLLEQIRKCPSERNIKN